MLVGIQNVEDFLLLLSKQLQWHRATALPVCVVQGYFCSTWRLLPIILHLSASVIVFQVSFSLLS